MTYLIRDYEAGNIIESCDTLEEAQAIVQQYEMQDKADGTFTEDFYEIVVETDSKLEAELIKSIFENR